VARAFGSALHAVTRAFKVGMVESCDWARARHEGVLHLDDVLVLCTRISIEAWDWSISADRVRPEAPDIVKE
jgi:hypothetical protein